MSSTATANFSAYLDTTLDTNALQQEAITDSSTSGALKVREQIVTLCRAVVDASPAPAQNVEAEQQFGRDDVDATQPINNLWNALKQHSVDSPVSPPAPTAIGTKPKTVVVCDTHPIVAEGLRTLLHGSSDMKVQATASSLKELTAIVQNEAPSLVTVDQAFGMQSVLDWLSDHKSSSISKQRSCARIVIWGTTSTPEQNLRFLNAGAHAILLKTDPAHKILECLRTAAAGAIWVDEAAPCLASNSDLRLTSREQQVMELVKCGLRNKDVATELGIREGTVKIHLRNIYQKSGVRGRHALAIRSLSGK